MSEQSCYPPPLQPLCRMGDARNTLHWPERESDYVAKFGLGPDHIPGLVKIAAEWVDADTRPKDEWFWAPIHAWRALGQLGTTKVVKPLLEMLNQLDDQDDQWYLEEFHHVFGMAGQRAIRSLAAYLADQTNAEYPRISVAHGLCEIAKRHPKGRSRVVDALTSQLAEQEPEVTSLNAFFISYLLELEAVESAEVIEQSFAAGLVDELVCGDWTDVRNQLGV